MPAPEIGVPPSMPTPPPASSIGSTGLEWSAPSAWKIAQNKSSFRIATYVIPKRGSDTENGDLSVSQAGGSVESNIERWKGQFHSSASNDGVRVDKATFNGLNVTIVEMTGTYNGMSMPGAPPPVSKDDQTLLAAIIETDPPHFFKMVGGKATVASAKADFEAMIKSVHKK